MGRPQDSERLTESGTPGERRGGLEAGQVRGRRDRRSATRQIFLLRRTDTGSPYVAWGALSRGRAPPYNAAVFDALVLWLHILAAAIFIGPQVFLAAIAVPALRGIEDAQIRQRTTRAVTRGFGWLGGGALLVLLATGIWNYYVAEDQGLIDSDQAPRYFIALQIKLTLVTVVLVLTILHGAVFGRRLQRLQEEGASEADLASARRWSMLASIATLAASVAILFFAALMGSEWSKQ